MRGKEGKGSGGGIHTLDYANQEFRNTGQRVGGREQSLRTVDPLVASCQHVVHGDCMLGLFGYNNGSVSNCEEG